MHKIYNEVKAEIDKIADKGITNNNLPILMQLIDIAKDIENIRYWRGSDSSGGSTLNDIIGELMILNEDLKHTDSLEHKDKYMKNVEKLLKEAEKLRYVFNDLNLTPEQTAKMKNIFR